ncbi:MAG TPA: PadR family transcriptional regulator [Anaerolineae bacterium]
MKNTIEFEKRHEGQHDTGAAHKGAAMHEPHGHHDHGPEHHGRGPGRMEHGSHGGRVRRGETRFVLLDTLSSGPKHGYEIVKAMDERSGGQYVPSPGTVYPTMQYLQDEGFVTAVQDGERRVFQLTDAGKAELDAHAAEVQGFWARFEARGIASASRYEMGFLEEELDSLKRTIWGGLGDAIEQGDQEMIRRVRQVVEGCRNDIRNIIKGDK